MKERVWLEEPDPHRLSASKHENAAPLGKTLHRALAERDLALAASRENALYGVMPPVHEVPGVTMGGPCAGRDDERVSF